MTSDVIPLHRCAQLRPGDQAGPYVLVEPLGSGGMGEVFLAEHEALGRRVALKIMRPEHLRNPRMHERFAREARLANRIRHPNVVAVTDQARLPDGRPYLAMELVEGVDVASYAERGLSLSEFCHLVRCIADGLDAAHSAGVVHRDLKPSNILVDRDGQPRLCDFGAARLHGVIDDRLTQTGQIVATPSYMSPEQATGEPADGRSDLYSLGVILWELVVGRRPFEGRSFGDFVLLHATQAAQAPSQAGQRQLAEPIPEALDDIILRCLAKRPEQRFASASELVAAIDQLDDDQPTIDSGALSVPPAATRPRRSTWLLAGGLFVAGALALLAALLFPARRLPLDVPSAHAVMTPVTTVPAQLKLPPVQLTLPVEAVDLPSDSSPVFAPTIVEASRGKKRHARAGHGDGAVASDELKDPYGSAP